MAWLKDVATEEMPDSLADVVKAQTKQYGFVLNSTRQAAHAPQIQLGSGAMGRAFTRNSQISKRLSHLLNLRVGSIVGCPF